MQNPWETRLPEDTLAHRFVLKAKQKWSKFAVGDTLGNKLSYGRLLVSVIVLAKHFKKMTAYQENVGIMLPTTVVGAVVNIALMLVGRTVINLNYTAGTHNIKAAIGLCDVKTVITSRKFVEKLGLKVTDEMVFMEDLRQNISFFSKVWTYFVCKAMSAEFLWNHYGNEIHNSDSTATIIFSSGSTGEPKGIMLSHHNILSNIEQLNQVFDLADDERFTGILPFFHSFGFTGTLWFPLLSGYSVAYHPNPTESRKVGKLVYQFKCTLLISTPTFCNTYVKNCEPEDFQSLRYVITGAEKLSKSIAISFKHKFGIEILEGYGCTELSPVVSLNLPGENKQGTIGKALPGIELKTVDPDDYNQDLEGDEGMLLVKGPNVMKGYYKRRDLTDTSFHKGWYITGDIASINKKGFITIHDRLARFSKVGGEMVPHLQIEEIANTLLGGANSFVCGIPDSSRGEQMVMLYVHETVTPQELWKKLKRTTLPNLWTPKQSHIYKVERIPVLGTGKVDLKTSREMALLKAMRGG